MVTPWVAAGNPSPHPPLPLWVPFVVIGGRAVQAAMGGAPLGTQPLAVLLDLDILFVVVASLAARFVLDD